MPADDLVLVHLEYLRERMDRTTELLEAQNGRLRRTETKVAVLEDRADEAKTAGKQSGAIWGTVVGAVVAGAVSVFKAIAEK